MLKETTLEMCRRTYREALAMLDSYGITDDADRECALHTAQRLTSPQPLPMFYYDVPRIEAWCNGHD